MHPVRCPRILQCAALAMAWLSVGCGRKASEASWWQKEDERINLSQQLALKEFRLQQLGANDLPELERLNRANKNGDASLKLLKEKKTALSSEFEDMQAGLADFRDSVIQTRREKAVGKTFTEFVSTSGRTYRDVTVASIDDLGVAIRHSDGTARLRYHDLDSSQQLFFGLEAGPAIAAAEKESQDAVAYERWMDVQMAQVRERQAETARIAANDREVARASRAAAASRVQLAASQRALAKTSSSLSSGGTRYYRSYYRPRYRYVYYSSYRTCFPRSCYAPSVRYGSIANDIRRGSFANTTFTSR